MRRLLDALITAVALIFFIPTFLVILSWNAIPGDSLYALKSTLENITLTILSGTPFVPEVSMKYTDRRLNEARILLDRKGSSVGYDLLVAEAAQTQNYIEKKNDDVTAAKFSENIDGYKAQIQTKKAEIIAQQESQTPSINKAPSTQDATAIVPLTTAVPQSQGGAQTTVILDVPQAVVITQEDPQDVVQKLDEVEDKLELIQDKLKNKNDDSDNGKGNKPPFGQIENIQGKPAD